MFTTDDERNTEVHRITHDVLSPDIAQAVVDSDAFTAYAVTLSKAGDDSPEAMHGELATVLADVGEDKLTWMQANTDVPLAAYLAKQIAQG